MHKIYYFVLFFAYIGICIDCQRGRGSSHHSSSHRSSSHRSSYSSHSSHHHYHGSGGGGGTTVIIVSLFGGLFLIGIAFYIFYKCYIKNESVKSNAGFVYSTNSKPIFYKCLKNESFKSNAEFVYSTNSQPIVEVTNLFHSGIWYSDYKQDDEWHGPLEMSLTFNPDSLEINGSGSDDVGLYSITGTYSHQTRRIGLTKSYRAGTGDVSQNLGHDVTIQLTYTRNTQFEGKWYVRTSEYSGEGEFVLKSKPEYGHVNNAYVKSEDWV